MKSKMFKVWQIIPGYLTLNLCVHAHGHDVDPIMEASYNNNIFLDIISSEKWNQRRTIMVGTTVAKG